MAKYVLVNRRAGKFTAQAKEASRASVATVLTQLGPAAKLADHDPDDKLARRVVILEAEADEIAEMQKTLPADAIIEPMIQRSLHPRRTPIELKPAQPLAVSLQSAQSLTYRVTVKGGGKPLAGIEVMFYLRDPGNQIRTVNVTTDKTGKASIGVPP